MPQLEKTGEQVLVTTGVDGRLQKATPFGWGRKIRKMRRDATLGFVRDMYMAPIMAAEWTVESDEGYEDAEEDIIKSLFPHRKLFLMHTVRGLMDFGWQAFETVYEYDEYLKLKKLKPLLQDITEILVTETGDLRGVRNLPVFLSSMQVMRQVGPWVDLNMSECAIFYRDVEGTNWYGEALMRRAEGPYDSWEECESAARRFDTKIAGAHWVIYYPPGTSPYDGREAVPNFEIAKAILQSLESSGRVAIPGTLRKFVQNLNDALAAPTREQYAWHIELISAQGATGESAFVGRQKYIDALKARAVGIPERAIFEGQFGTKAEAEAHADFAISNIEMGHNDILDLLNHSVVNHMLLVNRGESYIDKVRVKASPLSDVKLAWLRNLYTGWFESNSKDEPIDWGAVRDKLGVPLREVNEDSE